MEQFGAEDGGGSGDEFGAFIREKQKKWTPVAQQAKVRADAWRFVPSTAGHFDIKTALSQRL